MGENSHQPKLAGVVALINPYASSINSIISTFSFILDPMFSNREACSADIANTIFGIWFDIPCKISDKNGLYEELATMQCCVYFLYQLAMINLSLILKLTS